MAATLLGVWKSTVERSRDSIALTEAAGGRRWSRAELAASASAAAQRLGAGREDCRGRYVALAEPNGAGWLGAFLALMELGAVPLLLDATDPEGGRAAQARSLGAAWIWSDARLVPTGLPPPRRRRSGLAKVTSGSTGQPRALVFSDAQMIADGRQICATMGIRSGDTNLAVIPFGHSYGLGNLVVPLLLQGTPLVCGAGAFPQAIAADCRRWRPTVLPLVPLLLSALVRAPVEPSALASLRRVISAGSQLPPADAQAFQQRFGLPVHGFYGSSETGGICYDRSGRATLAGSSVGPPLRGVRLSARPGGRFLVESPAVMGSGRRRPPDLGLILPSGELVLRGRVGRLVKIAGRRLALAEVESALKKIRGVRDAAVLPSPRKAEALVAAVATDLVPAALRRALAGSLAPWKIPQRILAVSALPATARGKTDRRRVLDLFKV